MLFSQLFSEQFSQAMLPPSQSDVDGHNCVVPPPLYTYLVTAPATYSKAGM